MLEKSTFQAIWEQLNRNQRRFVVAMLDQPTKKAGAEAVGIQENTVYRWPPIVDQAIELLLDDARNGAVSILVAAAAQAAITKVGGLESDDEAMQQEVASEILDRVIGKAHQTLDVTSGGASFADYRLKTEEELRAIVAGQRPTGAGEPGAG